MVIILGFAIFLTTIYCLQQIVYFFSLNQKLYSPAHLADQDLPTVSICMAARNEEACIEIALRSLTDIDYPKEKLQVWIADDQSSDSTAKIIQVYAEQYTFLHYYLVDDKFEGIQGKQNALAHVIKKSASELIAIVDADTEVRPLWLKELTAHMDEGTSMVCGVTTIKAGSSFNALNQHFDWLYAGTMFKAHADLGHPLSGLGNNMLYTRAAYNEIGGYEGIRFCLNEDFRIFEEIHIKKKHGYRQVLNYNGTNLAVPIHSYLGSIKQRFRWLKGSEVAPIVTRFFFSLPYSLGFSITASFIASWQVGLLLFSTALLFHAPVRYITTKKVGQPAKLYFLPLWFITTTINGLMIPACYIFSNKIIWKGRKF